MIRAQHFWLNSYRSLLKRLEIFAKNLFGDIDKSLAQELFNERFNSLLEAKA